MQPSSSTVPTAPARSWVYASLAVIDGQRRLKPAQVSSDHLLFSEPPCLVSDEVEVIVSNGDEEQHTYAIILPHDPAAKRIPIQIRSPHFDYAACQHRQGHSGGGTDVDFALSP